jgi:putative membrane protein
MKSLKSLKSLYPKKNMNTTLRLATSNRNLLITGAVLAVTAGAACAALWSLRRQQFDPEKFITEAAEQSVAEMEAAKLALQKSASFSVKALAQEMFDDHAGFYRSLKTIAERKDLDIASDATLIDKAKIFVAKHQDEQSFDDAYIEHRISSHKAAIRLFQKAAKCPDADIRYFSSFVLPKLQHHLKMAQDLRKTLHVRQRAMESLHSSNEPAGISSKSGNSSRTNALPLASSETGSRSFHN